MLDIKEIIGNVETLLDQDEIAQVTELLNELYPSDIAYVTSHVDEDYMQKLTHIIIQAEDEHLEEIVVELEPLALHWFFRELTEIDHSKVQYIFRLLDSDDIVDILSDLPDDQAEEIKSGFDDEVLESVKALYQHEEDTAGRIMSPDFFSLSEEITVLDAFTLLKKSHDAEMIYYIFVVDTRNHLIGVVSVRDLLSKPNHLKMLEIMDTDVISVPVQMDQEDVARLVERYNLSAIPVVDGKNKLVGLITVDDVIDIIREEATEDIMKLAGTSEEEFSVPSAWQSFLRRMPWLLVSFFGGLLTIQSMSYFTILIPDVILLAFVPIIAGMGGNIGSQSSTIIVRGLATGKILVSELWEVMFREMLTGVLLGGFFGLILGIFAEVQFTSVGLIGLMVAVGMAFSMLIAATIGSLMPMIFEKFNIDPAVATGPFVSTTIDNIGLIGYLGSTLLMVKYLQ